MDHLRQGWRRVAATQDGARFQHVFLPADPHEAHSALIGLALAGRHTSHLVRLAASEYDHGRLHDLVADEGFSHHPEHGAAPSTGWMASYHAPEGSGVAQVHHMASIAPEHIAAHREAAAHHLAEPRSYQGGWHDTATGDVYLDASRHFDDKHEALDFAAGQKQKAVFHLNDFSEHFLHPKQDPLAMKDHDAWKSRYAETGTEPHPAFHSYGHQYPFTDDQKKFWGDKGHHVGYREPSPEWQGRPMGPWRSERHAERVLHGDGPW